MFNKRSQFFALPLVAILTGGVFLSSLSDAAPKNVATKKSSARSATGSNKKTTARSATGSTKATSGTAKKSARAATGTAKPAAKNSISKTSSTGKKKARSLSSVKRSARVKRDGSSGGRTRVINTVGNGTSFLDAVDDVITPNETQCIKIYTDCMDEQIKPVIDNYDWITEDEAYEVVIDTGEPFRCAFYDQQSTSLASFETDTKYCLGDDCFEQQNLNELYSAYNYHCDIRREHRNSINRFINQCTVNKESGSFATKYAIAYYREVLDRVDNGELKMINIEDSAFFQNFVSQLDLQNLDKYTINKSVANDFYAGLGLDKENELFSVHATPPVGAGGYLAHTQFAAATDKCFTAEVDASEYGTSKTGRANLLAANKRIALVAANNCGSIRSNLERYYLTGVWQAMELAESEQSESAMDEDEAGNPIPQTAVQAMLKPSGKDVKTSFLSAKDSCHMYENALISVRDIQYGLFDTQLQNYIEDTLIVVLNNKLKSMQKFQASVKELQTADKEIAAAQVKAAVDRQAKLDEQKALQEDAQQQMQEMASATEQKKQETLAAIGKSILSTYQSVALQRCSDMVKDRYSVLCKDDGSGCFTATGDLPNYGTFFGNMASYSIKINNKGQVVKSHDKNQNKIADYASYVPDTQDNKFGGYYEQLCLDVPGYDTTMPIFNMINNTLMNNYPSIRDSMVKKAQDAFSANN